MSSALRSSHGRLKEVTRRVASARAAVALGCCLQKGAGAGAGAAAASAWRPPTAVEGWSRASGRSSAGLLRASGSSSCSSSCREAPPRSSAILRVRPARIRPPASELARAPVHRSFSTSSHQQAQSSSSSSSFPSPSSTSSGQPDTDTEEPHEQQIRRAWSQSLASRRAQWSQSLSKDGGGGGGSRSALPKDIFDVSFSRSQGPGGQNVNKVNTKANVRLLLAAASSPSIFDSGKSPLPVPIPREVVSRLVDKSTYYTQASHSLLVSSESLRTQEGNLSDAIDKLLDHLHQHATADLVNPTPLHQKEKVQRLIAREKGKLKKVKSQRSAVKSGRRDKGF